VTYFGQQLAVTVVDCLSVGTDLKFENDFFSKKNKKTKQSTRQQKRHT